MVHNFQTMLNFYLKTMKRINVSLDSLDSKKFSLITNGGVLSKVLKGIKKQVI